MTEVKRIQEIIEKGLMNLEVNRKPAELYDPISYTLKLGGKRMRPTLALLACSMAGGEVSSALHPALGIELFHNFTLLHDDIMDAAPLRRGKETVYKKYNSNTAILSGDVMMVMAYQHLAGAPVNTLNQILDLFNTTAIEVCEGQQLDLVFEERNDVSIEEYLDMIRLKTAVLLGCSMSVGVLCTNRMEDAPIFKEIGDLMGMAFQLQDDILDTFGDPEKFGKQVGGDIIQNKKTFLLIKAMENADAKEKEELEKWISATEFDKTEKVKAVSAIYVRTGARDEAHNLRDSFYEKALDKLSRVDVLQEPKEAFLQLAQKLLNRDK